MNCLCHFLMVALLVDYVFLTTFYGQYFNLQFTHHTTKFYKSLNFMMTFCGQLSCIASMSPACHFSYSSFSQNSMKNWHFNISSSEDWTVRDMYTCLSDLWVLSSWIPCFLPLFSGVLYQLFWVDVLVYVELAAISGTGLVIAKFGYILNIIQSIKHSWIFLETL